MLAAIRLKGQIKARGEIGDTMQIIGLKKKLTMLILQEKPEVIGMLRKSQHFITWGELSPETAKQFGDAKTVVLRPPKGGFKSLKEMYPKGDLGYRGQAINDLIKRMI